MSAASKPTTHKSEFSICSDVLYPLVVNPLHAAKNQVVGSLLFGNLYATYMHKGRPDLFPFLYKYAFQFPATKLSHLPSKMPSVSLNAETLTTAATYATTWAKGTFEEHAPMIFVAAGTVFVASMANLMMKPCCKQMHPAPRVALSVIAASAALAAVLVYDATHPQPGDAPVNPTAHVTSIMGHLFTTQVLTFCAFKGLTLASKGLVLASKAATVTLTLATKVVNLFDWNPGFPSRAKIATPPEQDPADDSNADRPPEDLNADRPADSTASSAAHTQRGDDTAKTKEDTQPEEDTSQAPDQAPHAAPPEAPPAEPEKATPAEPEEANIPVVVKQSPARPRQGAGGGKKNPLHASAFSPTGNNQNVDGGGSNASRGRSTHGTPPGASKSGGQGGSTSGNRNRREKGGASGGQSNGD